MACVAATIAGCGERRSEPPAPPADAPRVVTLSPGVAETVAAIGLGSALVGRHAFDDATAPDVPAVGDQTGIDYEALLRVRPTHVLLERSAAGAPPRLLALASERGFVVDDVPMLSLDDIRGSIDAMPELLDAPAARGPADALLARFDAALRPAPGFAERAGRVLAVYWTRPVGVAGPGSYHAEVILRLGGSLAVDKGAAYQQLDAEDVRRLDPDSIALFAPGADPSRLNDLLGPLGSLDLRAVREGRVAVVNHPRGQTPGPSVIDVAEQLRSIVLSWPPLAGN